MRAFLILLLSLASCSGGSVGVEPPPPPPEAPLRVLFIGNSLTYFNDLPGTVAGLATSMHTTIEVASAAEPNLALIDHVNGESNALTMIDNSHWDYVVMQQGPSAWPLSRDTLIIGARLLDAHVKASGGRSALFMVWPESNRFGVFDDVRESYRAAAVDVNGLFLPAGEGWRAAWIADPQLMLYGPDGYHPSELGTYLAALVIYEGITGVDARTLPVEANAGGHKLTASESRVRLMQAAAHTAVTAAQNN